MKFCSKRRCLIVIFLIGSIIIFFAYQDSRVGDISLEVQHSINQNAPLVGDLVYESSDSKISHCDQSDTRNDPNRPNILLFVADQWRFDWADNYHTPNLPIDTPNFKFVSDHGTRFTQASVCSPLCVPSRACLATGREYHETGVLGNGRDLDSHSIVTMYKILSKNGYYVMSVGKDHLNPVSLNYKNKQNIKYQNKKIGFSDSIRLRGKWEEKLVAKQKDLDNEYNAYDTYTSWLKHNSSQYWNEHVDCLQNRCCLHSKNSYKNLDFIHQYNYTFVKSQDYSWHACPGNEHIPNDMFEDNWINEQAIKLLKQLKSRNKRKNNTINSVDINKQPWFLQINYQSPHPPFMVTQSMYDKYHDKNDKLKLKIDRLTNDESLMPINKGYKNGKSKTTKATLSISKEYIAGHVNVRSNYLILIENLDKLMGKLFDYLKDEKLFLNTIICITSDHGALLGDYGRFGKRVPWIASTNVPLVCMGPNIKRNQTITKPVTNMDLVATFLDYSNSLIKYKNWTTNTKQNFNSNSNSNFNYIYNYNYQNCLSDVVNQISSHSLRSMLEDLQIDGIKIYRDHIHSSFQQQENKWRVIIKQEIVDGYVTIWKYICCREKCPIRKFDTNIQINKVNFNHVLFNLSDDLFENHNLIDKFYDKAYQLRQLMPNDLF